MEDIVALVGGSPQSLELELAGEAIRIETSVSWENSSHRILLIEAVAYGPASWHTERIAERVRIEVEASHGAQGDV